MSRILIVDDLPTQRACQKMWLERQPGWHVLCAENGIEAISVIENEPIDIVATDMLMPKMDGLELIKALQDSFPNTPVIFVPDRTQAGETIAAIELGAVNYVSEAGVNHDLVDAVDLVLSLADSDQAVAAPLPEKLQLVLPNDRSSLIAGAKSIANTVCGGKLRADRRRMQLAVSLYYLFSDVVSFGHLELDPTLRRDNPYEFENAFLERRDQQPYASRKLTIDVAGDAKHGIQICVQHEGTPIGAEKPEDIYELADPPTAANRAMLLVEILMEETDYNPKGRQFKLLVPAGAPAAAG